MALKTYTKENQANGNFNGGQILEKKPIGFPQDGGMLRPYSNLFYWAHAWAPKNDSIIGLHPHRGFEICSFVLKGEIEHYDTLLDKWITLKEGDVQVIKAGKGISHSEKLKKGSEIFQIWFDPNLHESLYEEANYSDFKSEIFSIKKENGKETKIISDINNQIDLKSDSIQIYQHSFIKGIYHHEIGQDRFHSIFIQYGRLKINDEIYNSGDFLIVDSEVSLSIEIISDTKVFEIISLIELPYSTYAQMHNIS
ncbi:MAG: pirin family protein [Flavobacteriaceae bacterium]|nr:pirin family protein [Flavobacteriaceae bacterium]